jgi:cyclohexanone monooxygenase
MLIAGAGFGGMYMLHKARAIGIEALAFEAAPDVGGVWYWNTYPGARCDGESLVYSYSFDEDLQQEWTWPERFSAQPDILRYARHVADRFDLRRDIRFGTRVTSARWDEGAARWAIETDRGDRISARWFVAAVGCLSTAKLPGIPGLGDFAGEWYHTGEWPRETVDFSGRRVAVIGTGSSGVQAIPMIAEEAADLTVFQRTPNYSVPSKNRPTDPAQEREIKSRYGEIRELARTVGLGIVPITDKNGADVTPEERQAEFQKRWDYGGPLFMLSFRDMMVDPDINEAGCEFIRANIRATVKDPETAELLCPKGYPIGAKRICVDTNYFETYNRPNVHLVDIKSDPIARIVPDGVMLASGKRFEVDRIVFATGYDAMTGSLLRMDVRGKGGVGLAEKWSAGPRTYLGIATAGFPNYFVITGPGSPSVIGNVIQGIEQHVEWLGELLAKAMAEGIIVIEADAGFEDRWVDHVNEAADATLFPRAESWYLGADVPGKPRVFMPYVAGAPAYRLICNDVRDKGYAGFHLTRAADVGVAAA